MSETDKPDNLVLNMLRAVETDVDILLARGEVDDGREYPYSAISVAQYVEEFIKANHYK